MLWNLCSLSQGFSVQIFHWQYSCLHWRFNRKMNGYSGTKTNRGKMARNLYRMIGKAMSRGDEAIVYQTSELLKLSFGGNEHIIDGAGRLTALCAAALGKKQYAIAGHLLEAYRFYVKNAVGQDLEEALQGLILLIDLAKRAHQEYILGKAAGCAFGGISRLIAAGDRHPGRAVDVIKAIGLNAVKTHDAALFQHAAKCLLNVPLAEEKERVYQLVGVWLHQLIKRDDVELLQIFFQWMEILRSSGNGMEIAECISKESDNLIGIIGVNHRMRCKAEFIHFLLETAQGAVQNMRRVVYNIGRMARITIGLHGLRQGFDVLLPVLELGRLYLNKELRFRRLSDEGQLKMLFSVMSELIFLFELIARQDGKIAGTEVLMSFKEYWLSCYQKEVNRKSVNQFCQLLLKKMVLARKRRIRNLCEGSQDLLDYALFSDNQIKKLGLG